MFDAGSQYGGNAVRIITVQCPLCDRRNNATVPCQAGDGCFFDLYRMPHFHGLCSLCGVLLICLHTGEVICASFVRKLRKRSYCN